MTVCTNPRIVSPRHISHAGTALGILAKDGIVLAAERKVTSKLLEQDTSAEIFNLVESTFWGEDGGLSNSVIG
jgi:20S proteasome alpha/beta subunit